MRRVRTDAGIAQYLSLRHVVVQCYIVGPAAQGKFRHQQRIQAVRRKRPLRRFGCGFLRFVGGRRGDRGPGCGTGAGAQQL